MNGPAFIQDQLEALRSQDAAEPLTLVGLHNHVAEDWMAATALTRRQFCDVVAAWLVFGFGSGRLTFDFADLIANDLHLIAQAEAPVGTSDVLAFHTPLSWETYLAFDAGEFTADPAFDPVERVTRPLIADLVQRSAQLAEYPPALSGLSLSPAGST